MAGLNDRRRLGTDSGRIRREARAVARAGGNPNDLLQRAAITKLGEGSAISSSEENIAFDDYKKRMQSGLMESQRRATLGGDSLQSFDADLDRSALVKTDPAARQRAYDRGATLGVSREDIDKRAGTLPGTAPVQTGTAPPPIGSSPRPTLQGPPASAKSGLIDGKPARSVIDSMRGPDTEPGNLAGLAARDAADREAAITAARTESAGNDKVTRQSVIDRINKERVASGRTPFGDDIYADIGERGVEERSRTAKGKELSRVAGNLAESAMTPLQKSLADARNRFAPPPVEEPDLPVRPLFNTTEDERQPAREDASGMVNEKARQDGASLLATRPKSLGSALLQDVESLRDRAQGATRAVDQASEDLGAATVRGAKRMVKGANEASDKMGEAFIRGTVTTGNSLLSRVPGATGSYLRNRFTR